MAADFGRLVFAVPGSPLDPRCHGTNNLLKQGAIVTTGSDDVLEALAPHSELSAAGGSVIEEPDRDDGGATFVPPDESERASIISALGPTPVEIDDIIRPTTLPASVVYLVLLELDLAGRLHRHPGVLVSIAMAD